MKSLGYYNGKIGAPEELTVPFTDRGLYFGDGVYDATTSANHIPFAIDDHIDRFFRSFQAARIPFSMSKRSCASFCATCAPRWRTAAISFTGTPPGARESAVTPSLPRAHRPIFWSTLPPVR